MATSYLNVYVILDTRETNIDDLKEKIFLEGIYHVGILEKHFWHGTGEWLEPWEILIKYKVLPEDYRCILSNKSYYNVCIIISTDGSLCSRKCSSIQYKVIFNRTKYKPRIISFEEFKQDYKEAIILHENFCKNNLCGDQLGLDPYLTSNETV